MENNHTSFKYTHLGKIKGRRYCLIGDNKLKKQLARVLSCMITRCYNTKHKEYKKYGAKGITICDEWIGAKGLDNFYEWATANGFSGEKDSKGYNVLSIDRIDNDKGYSPDNCRWATREQQARNKSTTIWVEYKGEKDTLKGFCKKLDLDYHAVFLRIYRRHWSIEKALSTPIQKNHQIEYNGQLLEFNTIARLNGLIPTTLKYQWKKNNYDIYKALQHFKGEEWKKNLSKA